MAVFLAVLLLGCASAASSSWLIPVRGVGSHDLVDSFGDARGGGRAHEGIDIFAARGTRVVSATSGTIARIGSTVRGGRCLWIYSDEGYDLYYAHLDRWQPGLVAGNRVEAGEVIGYVGNTGNAAGGRCHLHFEIRDGDTALNPYRVFEGERASRPQSAGVSPGD